MPAELASERGYGRPRHAVSKIFERLRQAVFFVGAREMRHQAQRRHRRRGGEALADARDVRRPEAQPVHAGVDLDEHFQRPRQRRGLQHLHLLDVVHDDGQAPCGDLAQLALGEKSFEQQDAAHVVLLAQHHRGIELDQRQAVGVLERRQDAREAVAVGIGLDHRQHLRAGRLFAHARQVAAHRGKVDLGVQRSGHACG